MPKDRAHTRATPGVPGVPGEPPHKRGTPPKAGVRPPPHAKHNVTASHPPGAARGSQPSLTTKWGLWIAAHRWTVIWAWIGLLVAAALAYPHLMANLSAPDYSVTGSDSAKVTELMASDFSAAGAEQDVIVFNSDKMKFTDLDYQDAVDRVVEAVKDQPGVVAVVSPTDAGAHEQISEDKTPPTPRWA